MKVSVIIPCRDEAEFITELLDAVRAQELPPTETIVVDNGSTDDSVASVTAYAGDHPHMHIRVLHCARPGAAAAMNTGIRAAAGDIIVRIDGHSRPRPDYIRRAVAHLAEPKVGVVGGVWEIESGAPTLRAAARAWDKETKTRLRCCSEDAAFGSIRFRVPAPPGRSRTALA